MNQKSEAQRLEALNAYQVMNSDSEKEYDELTKLASSICETPISMINLIDKDEQWSKSVFGTASSVRRIPRSKTICQYALQKNDLFEVSDLSADDRFKDFPYVKNEPGLKYYLGAPLENPEGHIIGTLCILDYVPRKLNEEKKNQLRILANQVMAHLELRKQNVELRRLNSFHVDLMKMLSHDLRAPLNGIIGLADLMVEAPEMDQKESEIMIRGIGQSAQQLNQMIGDILNYTILDSTGFELNRENADLQKTVEKMKSIYQPLAKFKNITLTFSGSALDEVVNTDIEKFEQIFGNLLSNAIKFTEKGGSVNISLDSIAQNGSSTLILSVKDTGIGIPEEVIAKLLKGETVGKTTGTSGEISSGLGSKIVRHFTGMLNGTLEIVSEVGTGSEFIITIPQNKIE